MKNNGLKNAKAITLIAMVVTIIVLLILAGVSIAVLTGENGILNRATSAKQTNEQKKAEEELKLGISALSIDYRKNTTNPQTFREFVVSNSGFAELKTAMGLDANNTDLVVENAANGVLSYKGQKYQVDNYGVVTEYVPMWTQDKTTITKGDVTLEVGQAVSGYSVTANIGGTDTVISNWYVLGAEDGKLLITTNQCYEKITLSGIEDWANGSLTKLKPATTKYNDNIKAYSTRSISYNDIDRIAGFYPEISEFAIGKIWEYGNKVTYTIKEDGEVWYKGTKYPTNEEKVTYRVINRFEYWNESKLNTLEVGESATLTSSYRAFAPTSILNQNVIDMLFSCVYNSNYIGSPNEENSYWLNYQMVETNAGYASYEELCCHTSPYEGGGEYEIENLFSTTGMSNESTRGLRPVVVLKPDVSVSNEGEIL